MNPKYKKDEENSTKAHHDQFSESQQQIENQK